MAIHESRYLLQEAAASVAVHPDAETRTLLHVMVDR
ncbi:hypothetical protein NODU109028_04740 [Nocardioides dubius]